jgi:hypothetical protein
VVRQRNCQAFLPFQLPQGSKCPNRQGFLSPEFVHCAEFQAPRAPGVKPVKTGPGRPAGRPSLIFNTRLLKPTCPLLAFIYAVVVYKDAGPRSDILVASPRHPCRMSPFVLPGGKFSSCGGTLRGNRIRNVPRMPPITTARYGLKDTVGPAAPGAMDKGSKSERKVCGVSFNLARCLTPQRLATRTPLSYTSLARVASLAMNKIYGVISSTPAEVPETRYRSGALANENQLQTT